MTDGATDPEWPVPLRGVTESVVTTLGPNDRWNVAALGLHAGTDGDPVTARTFGNTRTRRNFEGRGGGVVQFVTDPRVFVDAALSIHELERSEGPVLDSAAAWVEVEVAQIDETVEDGMMKDGTKEDGTTEDGTMEGGTTEGGTTIREWELAPAASEVIQESVPTINRGFGAVVEATVAASRLDVPGFDTAALLDRLEFFADVVARTGGEAEREAFARVDAHTEWRERLE